MRTMWRERRTPVWVGAAIVSALVAGVVIGSWTAPRPAHAQAPSVILNGSSGLWQWVVNEGQTENFEQVIRAYGESLAARSGGSAGFTLYRSAAAGPAVYFGHVTSVQGGGEYHPIRVLAEHYPPGPPNNGDEVRELVPHYSSTTLAQQGIFDLRVVASY